MKVQREKLVDALEKAAPALGFNILVPEFHYFQIDREKVQATDGALLIDTSLPQDVGFSCAVPGEPFLYLLKSLSEDEVDLIHEGNTLKVKTNKVKGSFATAPLKSYETVDLLECDELPKPYADIFLGLDYCKYGVSKDETLGPCCGVRIEGPHVLSTDRYRIIKWDLEKDYNIRCSLPLKFIDVLLKNKMGVCSLFFSEDSEFIAILTDGTYISTPVLTGEYPDLLQYFPMSENYREVTLQDDFDEVLSRHINFLKNLDAIEKEILIKITKDKCTVTSVDKELGVLSEEISALTSEEEDVEFSVNPLFLKDVVQKCSTLKYFVDEGVVLFEAERLKYLVQTRE